MTLKQLACGCWHVCVLNELGTHPACEKTFPTLTEARRHGVRYLAWRTQMGNEVQP